MNDHSELSLAFGQGSDSRFAGVSPVMNPYTETYNFWQHRYWQLGWEDMDRNWGKFAKWPVRELPEVS